MLGSDYFWIYVEQQFSIFRRQAGEKYREKRFSSYFLDWFIRADYAIRQERVVWLTPRPECNEINLFLTEPGEFAANWSMGKREFAVSHVEDAYIYIYRYPISYFDQDMLRKSNFYGRNKSLYKLL